MRTTQFITVDDLDTFITADEKARLTSGAAGSPARYAQAIDDANSEVAGYVGNKELASVPGALKRHTCAVARYALWKDAASPKVKDEYDNAMAFLRLVANGTFQLDLAPPSPEAPAPAGGVWYTSRPLRFTGRAY